MISALPRIVRLHDLAYCAAGAVHLLREREAKYPALVNAGRMTATDAAEGLERLRCVVAQWKWVTDPARPPMPAFDNETGEFGAFNYLLANEMHKIAAATRTRADQYPDSFEICEFADLCEALAWYQEDHIPGVARIIMHLSSTRPAAPQPAAAALRRAA